MFIGYLIAGFSAGQPLLKKAVQQAAKTGEPVYHMPDRLTDQATLLLWLCHVPVFKCELCVPICHRSSVAQLFQEMNQKEDTRNKSTAPHILQRNGGPKMVNEQKEKGQKISAACE